MWDEHWIIKQHRIRHIRWRCEREEKALSGKIPSCRNMLGVGCRIRALIEVQMLSPATAKSFKLWTFVTSAVGWTQLITQSVSTISHLPSFLSIRHCFIWCLLPSTLFTLSPSSPSICGVKEAVIRSVQPGHSRLVSVFFIFHLC